MAAALLARKPKLGLLRCSTPITSEVPGRKSTGPGPSHFAHVPPVLWRSRPPFPGFRKKVAHGPDLCPQRCLEVSRATVSPLTHARNLPTESNSTSCHPCQTMLSHEVESAPGSFRLLVWLYVMNDSSKTRSFFKKTLEKGNYFWITANGPSVLFVNVLQAQSQSSLRLKRMHGAVPGGGISHNVPAGCGTCRPVLRSCVAAKEGGKLGRRCESAGAAARRVICCRGRASTLWFLSYVEYVSGRSQHAFFCTDFE